MKKIILLTFISLILPILGSPIQAAENAAGKQPVQESVIDEEAVINALLEEKFKTAKYSKKGADTCLKCHDKESDKDSTDIFHAKHGQSDLANGPFQKLECESCHGPIGNHARKPRKGKEREPMVTFGADSPVTAENQNSVCTSCHENDHERSDWIGSAHETNEVSCTSCHTLHEEKDTVLDKLVQGEVCTSCHVEREMDEHKRSSHPVGEGQLACSSCHNPHGSLTEDMLKQVTVNETCTDCHTEKRGPFLTEHAPVVESCINCHNPHSSNEKSLLTQRPPFLCQNCHQKHQRIDFGDDSGGNDKYVAGKSCMNCHTKIHGSSSLEHYGLRR